MSFISVSNVSDMIGLIDEGERGGFVCGVVSSDFSALTPMVSTGTALSSADTTSGLLKLTSVQSFKNETSSWVAAK